MHSTTDSNHDYYDGYYDFDPEESYRLEVLEHQQTGLPVGAVVTLPGGRRPITRTQDRDESMSPDGSLDEGPSHISCGTLDWSVWEEDHDARDELDEAVRAAGLLVLARSDCYTDREVREMLEAGLLVVHGTPL